MPEIAWSYDPAGWVEIARVGEVRDKRGLHRFTLEDLRACAAAGIIDGFEALVDFEHWAHADGGSTLAAGWLQELEMRGDSLWARVRWTDRGKAALEGGEYRFCSPVLQCVKIDGAWRPRFVAGLALTNQPNLRGLTPITHRNPAMERIALALGLPADATEEQIVAAIAALQQQVTTATTEMAHREIADAGITDPVERDRITPILLTHRDAGRALLGRLKQAGADASKNRLLHRQQLNPPKPGADEDLTPEQIRHRYGTLRGRERREFFKKHSDVLFGENRPRA